ncbi:hypothetical protein F442_01555 [Phytophthora nicotianae P10297]|uniref:BHLH domain-containing protein n=1 Tax=Phytophthora nicotianae P10297 TaxID=1317064 RepID=W3A4U6_PHYNI|nr:hypothetical protein F442_01555 [Phytophthora nicotianae P10297]
MSGQQIEELGDYLLQTELRDNRSGVSPVYTNEQQQRDIMISATSGEFVDDHLISPPLGSYMDLLQNNDIASATDPFPGIVYDASATDRSQENSMELVNFSLEQQQTKLSSTAAAAGAQRNVSIKPSTCKRPSLQCQSIWSSDDDNTILFNDDSTPKRSNVINEDDRGFRKKSREKMRRQEASDKFVDLLEINSRVRKKVVLHEAISAIKCLRRECNQLRRDRERLQQELHKLAACVQYSQAGLGAVM